MKMLKPKGVALCVIILGMSVDCAGADVSTNQACQAATNSAGVAVRAAEASMREVKVEPGAILTIWNGKDMAEAEIATIVDKGKAFASQNANVDPAARNVARRTCKWSGILNIEEPGVYVFNATFSANLRGGDASVLMNGTPVAAFAGAGTCSKRIEVPGPVNLDVTLSCMMKGRRSNHSVALRYKKAGDLNYTVIAPETLYHSVQ